MTDLKCVLCTDDPGPAGELVRKFDLERWNRVKSSAQERLKCPNKLQSKYWSVCSKLPTQPTERCGYHSSCYNKFNAITKYETTSMEIPTPKPLLRSKARSLQSSSTGILPAVCIFCTKSRKKKNGVELPLTNCELDSVEENIKDAASTLNDEQMLAKVGNIGFHSKEVKYHNACKREYLNMARAFKKEQSKSEVEQTKEVVQEIAFRQLLLYVQSSVIDNNRPEYLVSLHRQYCKSLDRIAHDENIEVVKFTPKTLGQKLVKTFGEKVTLEMGSRKQGLVLYNSTTSKDDALKMAASSNSSDEFKVIESANILHSALIGIMKTCPDLPASLSLDDFKKGQADPPELLLKFFQVLICGSNNDVTEKVNRQAMSLAQDALFCSTKGKVKPSKHLCTGLGMKSLTGSRKVIDILNRFGHSVSYNVVEGIETEIASSITERDRVLPDMLLQKSGLCTATAFDNYDELTDTLSGKDTLHDTVGICYQNKEPMTHDDERRTAHCISKKRPLEEGGSGSCSKRRRRRQYDPPCKNIHPYKRKPSMSRFSYEMYEGNPPENLSKIHRMKQIWMMSCFLQNDTPMWRGWNSLTYQDSLPQQTIGYMENIELPPTRLDVVQETLCLAQKVAEECGEQYAIVTYDLAIAKPALQIQANESPKYDNVFICFGAFHISMAYFSSLGYLLDSSGGPEVLCNADVLGSGSVNGFLSGKHFNRCKRLHPLLATAMQIMHFRSFAELHGGISEEVKSLLDSFAKNPTDVSLSTVHESSAFNTLLDRYDQYTECTRNGEHGMTARFWIRYVDLVHFYLLFDYACRTNDVDLYIYALGLLCPIFFATHRPNYARWMVRFYLNLLNMDQTHEGIRGMFEGGALSIRRTSKNFSRSAVDLTLEQTINRDAASRQGGIAAFTQCVSARKRWTLTRSYRGAVVSCLLDMAGMTASEETSQETKPYRIKRDNSDLQAVVKSLGETLNPFEENLPDLFCLTTGRAASAIVQNDLTQVVEKGTEWHRQFVEECKADANRFEKPIKRRKVKNFSVDAVKTKISAKDTKIKEIRCTRDIFGRLLFLAATRNLDLAEVLSFPLTEVPFSLCRITGALNKTDKSALMKTLELESTSRREPANSIDVYILDAMFFLRTLPELPKTYGGIARLILQQACCLAKVVHIVCDTYHKGPSIKGYESEKRGSHQVKYSITGPSQNRPTNFNQALLSHTFKTALLLFLEEEWKSSTYVKLLEGRTVFFALEDHCSIYSTNSGMVQVQEIQDLQSDHEEADTRMIFHAYFIGRACQTETPTLAVRSCDTDVFILLLHHAKHINANILMDTGTSSRNTRRMVNISQLAETLTAPVCSALPAFHAFTGCDYTAAFLRKAKTKPYHLMLRNEQFISAFIELGSDKHIESHVTATLQQFVCCMYGVKKVNQVNEARYFIFKKMYCPQNEDKPFDKIKATDPCCLPPCETVLHQKILRANYVAHMWKNAGSSTPVTFPADGQGWKLTDSEKLEFVWFEGPQNPRQLFEELADCDSDDDNKDDEDQTYSISSDEEDDGDQ